MKGWRQRRQAPDWQRYSTQAWRRGMAADIARKAKNLRQILDGGDWSQKSRAYLTYIRLAYGGVEAKTASAAFIEESDKE